MQPRAVALEARYQTLMAVGGAGGIPRQST
jgi:hypothetical protein